MKLKKKSTLIGAISVLAGVSVISVGFASWVVSAGDKTSVEGSISVETVDDQRHTLTAGNSNPNLAARVVKYGVPENAEASGVVLSHDNTGDFEHLNIGTFTYTVAHWATADLEIAVTEKGEASTWYKHKTTGIITKDTPSNEELANYDSVNKKGYEYAKELGLVGDLPTYDRDLQVNGTDNPSATNLTINTSAALSDGAKTFTFILNFKWGKNFKGNYLAKTPDANVEASNPYTFYNSPSYNDAQKREAAAEAVVNLSNLKTLLTGVEYVLTLTTTHVAVAVSE